MPTFTIEYTSGHGLDETIEAENFFTIGDFVDFQTTDGNGDVVTVFRVAGRFRF